MNERIWLVLIFCVLLVGSVNANKRIIQYLPIEEMTNFASTENCFIITTEENNQIQLEIDHLCFLYAKEVTLPYQSIGNVFATSINLNINDVVYSSSQVSDFGKVSYEGGEIDKIINLSKTSLFVELLSDDSSNSFFIGTATIYLWGYVGELGHIWLDGFIVNDLRMNVSFLEQEIEDLQTGVAELQIVLTSVQTDIINLWNSVNGHFNILTNHEDRLIFLENNQSNRSSSPNYFKYLSSSDRKKMVCGYAQDKNMTHHEDLGFSCDLEYKYSRSGKLSVRCKCNEIKLIST